MKEFNENDVLYTDSILQILSAYILGSEDLSSEELTKALENSLSDPSIQGPGMIGGLLYAAIVHMALLLASLAESTNTERVQTLQRYAMSYSNFRKQLSQMPQLRPEFVNEIMFKFFNQINKNER